MYSVLDGMHHSGSGTHPAINNAAGGDYRVSFPDHFLSGLGMGLVVIVQGTATLSTA